MASRRPRASALEQITGTVYRYRTAALVGPWRHIRQQAADDAVSAGQARIGEAGVPTIQWIIDGFIEEGDSAILTESSMTGPEGTE